jgi:hypothetical protein
MDDEMINLTQDQWMEKNGTLDGFTEASRVGADGPRQGETKAEGDEDQPEVSCEMDAFRKEHAWLARMNVHADESFYAGIKPLKERVVKRLMVELGENMEHAISFGTVGGTELAKERAVRYWRIFCALLGIPPTPSSFRDAYVLSYFAAYMGLVWRKHKGKDVNLQGATVAQTVSMVRRWLHRYYNITILDFDPVTSLVVKGLQKKSGKGLGVLELPVVSFVYLQKKWREEGTPLSLLLADSQILRFLMLRRVSETNSTSNHDGSAPGKDARYVLHHNVWYDGTFLWFHWPWTKTGPLTRPFPKSMLKFFVHLMARLRANEQWLKDHPKFKRENLAFFHLEGVPVHRRVVETEMRRLLLRAVVEEPGVGHVNIVKFRICTHSDRRGGSVWYLVVINGKESFVKWLGNWKSLAFFTYAKVSRDYANKTWGSIEAAIRVMDAVPLERVHGGCGDDPVCSVCKNVFVGSQCDKDPAKMKRFCDECWLGPRNADCRVFLAMCVDNV